MYSGRGCADNCIMHERHNVVNFKILPYRTGYSASVEWGKIGMVIEIHMHKQKKKKEKKRKNELSLFIGKSVVRV